MMQRFTPVAFAAEHVMQLQRLLLNPEKAAVLDECQEKWKPIALAHSIGRQYRIWLKK
jgi:hypothetical protein